MATAKIEEYTGIVLQRIPQKEHDAMIRCLGEYGLFTFYSRGALKMGTSAGFSTQELTLGHYNLIVSTSGSLTLKEGRIGHFFQPGSGLEGLLVAQLCLEYCAKCLSEEDASSLYPYLKGALEGLQQGNDPYSVAVMFLAKALSISGYGLEVGHCVNCGSKTNIVSMDIGRGGFLCGDCYFSLGGTAVDADELRIYRHAFRYPLEDLSRVIYPKIHAQAVLTALLRYFHDATGQKLRALDPMLKH